MKSTKVLLPLVLLIVALFVSPAAHAACSQSGHAWFDYTTTGATSVNRGGAIWLSAAGVVGKVKFTFFGASGSAYVYNSVNSANGNCVLNQELFGVNLLPDTYTIGATFQDGNTNRQVINAYAGTVVVNEPSTPPPGSASCGQPAHVFFTPNTVRTGQTVTFGGVTYPGTFSQVRIKNASTKATVASFYLPPAGMNCVENQQAVTISFAPGTYNVRADFIDEFNILHNDLVGTLTVTP